MDLKAIKNLAIFVLEDNEFNKLMNYLSNNQLNDARLLIERLMDETELNLITSEDNTASVYINHYGQLRKIESEIFNLYEVIDEEGKQIKQFSR